MENIEELKSKLSVLKERYDRLTNEKLCPHKITGNLISKIESSVYDIEKCVQQVNKNIEQTDIIISNLNDATHYANIRYYLQKNKKCLVHRDDFDHNMFNKEFFNDENIWCTDVDVRVNGTSKYSISDDCDIDDVGMDYEIDYDIEHKYKDENEKEHIFDLNDVVWISPKDYFCEDADGEWGKKDIEYEGDHHGVWASVNVNIPGRLIMKK